MDRRGLIRQLAWAFAGCSPLLARAQQKNTDQPPTSSRWQAIEAGAAGRLGVAVLDTASGRLEGHRLDERFPMCSTFKWLAAAHVLQRVDAGREQLDRRVRYGRDVLLPHSPVTGSHTGEGLTMAELCEAAVTVSDNAAANLILQSLGGPAALTRYARSLGDRMTRLDRREPALNEARPGDPRDTTTPRAMATALRAAVLGDALSPASRAQLVRWLEATSTNGQRLRADLPAGWRMGSKTGSGAHGTANDVGVFWPPAGRAPLVVAVYLTESAAAESVRNAALAQVARVVSRGG
jgi:beta-lactamase class A